jgi:hypothetical protein
MPPVENKLNLGPTVMSVQVTRPDYDRSRGAHPVTVTTIDQEGIPLQSENFVSWARSLAELDQFCRTNEPLPKQPMTYYRRAEIPVTICAPQFRDAHSVNVTQRKMVTETGAEEVGFTISGGSATMTVDTWADVLGAIAPKFISPSATTPCGEITVHARTIPQLLRHYRHGQSYSYPTPRNNDEQVGSDDNGDQASERTEGACAGNSGVDMGGRGTDEIGSEAEDEADGVASRMPTGDHWDRILNPSSSR